MKFLVSIFLIALLSFALGLYMPWWSLALAAFVVAALIHQRAGKSFLTGFLALFLLWGILAFIIDQQNQQVLSKKVAQLLSLGEGSIVIILITGLVGGLVAGFAAMSGSYLRTVTR
ncbi:MAG TPA: hypothetical protein VD993_03150 [Chitinophagaceae bacterium]|nr:hypothetical protein [Chitinophagaceae bacterium]